MPTLIVSLPLTGAGPATEYRYVVTRDEQTVHQHGVAQPALLPAGMDLVAVVPVRQLSWLSATLPKGAASGGATRLRAVLDGLLEDRLLDDPQRLHLALGPAMQAAEASSAEPSQATRGAPSVESTWVAACDREWLTSVLQPLEQAGRPVTRIVPELWPSAAGDRAADGGAALTGAASADGWGEPGGAGQIGYLMGDALQPWLVHPHAQGVTRWPVSSHDVLQWLGLTASAMPGVGPVPVRRLLAEPSVMDWVQQQGADVQDRTTMQPADERWLHAALRSPWDLAQFELANAGAQRTIRRMQSWSRQLISGPRWRWARRGLVLALVINLVGLNAWAWREKQRIASKRQAVQAVLTQTFPQVKVVVDAPAQMLREVELLRQRTGAPTDGDLESLLAATAQVLPAPALSGVQRIEYTSGQLRLSGPLFNDSLLSAHASAMQSRGLSARMDGGALVVTVGGK